MKTWNRESIENVEQRYYGNMDRDIIENMEQRYYRKHSTEIIKKTLNRDNKENMEQGYYRKRGIYITWNISCLFESNIKVQVKTNLGSTGIFDMKRCVKHG